MSSEKPNQQDHHRMMIQDFKKRFWISLVITVPVLLLSPTVQSWLGWQSKLPGESYLLTLLSTVIFGYGGWPFLRGMVAEIKNRQPGMMTLIAVAIIVAYGYSTLVALGLEGRTFFWELATLIVVMLLGHWIEMRSVLRASRAVEELMTLLPDEAHVIEDGEIRDVPVTQLQIGDHIQIKPGEQVPTDGRIDDGQSSLDEQMLTGEGKPVPKTAGDTVIGGSINGSGLLRVVVTADSQENYLSKVVDMVQKAQSSKSKTQRFADRAAFWLTVVALSAGSLTLLVWLALGSDFSYALERMVSVMVITCPHALGLAIPLVAANSTALSARQGLLIRNRTAFEQTHKLHTVLFDKTGTLTHGVFGVSQYTSLNKSFSDEQVLAMAATLETGSEHPIAQGILDKAKEKELKLHSMKDFAAMTGQGIKGTIRGHTVRVVSPAYLKEKQITVPSTPEKAQSDGTVVYVLQEKTLIGFLVVEDQIRKESLPAIHALQKSGIRCIMLTGDNEAVAKAVCEELRMDDYKAEVLPNQKLEYVKHRQEKGERVAMTGDGINDAPALAQADVGIAIGSGTDVAAETADIILVDSNPKDISRLILFGKATYRKTIQNLIWASAYNILAIPLAAGVFLPVGLAISPAASAALMSLSTVIVAINAQLLKVQS